MEALSQATLTLQSLPTSWANAISFVLRTPVFSTASAPVNDFGQSSFQLSSSFYSTDTAADISSTAFRGPASSPTLVNFELTPTIVNSSASNTVAVAFEPSLLGFVRGETVSPNNFTVGDGFTVQFVLNRNTFSLV